MQTPENSLGAIASREQYDADHVVSQGSFHQRLQPRSSHCLRFFRGMLLFLAPISVMRDGTPLVLVIDAGCSLPLLWQTWLASQLASSLLC